MTASAEHPVVGRRTGGGDGSGAERCRHVRDLQIDTLRGPVDQRPGAVLEQLELELVLARGVERLLAGGVSSAELLGLEVGAGEILALVDHRPLDAPGGYLRLDLEQVGHRADRLRAERVCGMGDATRAEVGDVANAIYGVAALVVYWLVVRALS